MKFSFNKKDLNSYVESLTLPRNEEATVTFTAISDYVEVGITHEEFHLHFPIKAEVEMEGEASFALSSVKKAIKSTKVKVPVLFEGAKFIQDKEWELEPYTSSFFLEGEDTTLTLKGTEVAMALTPLPLFTQKDPLYSFRNEVFLEKTEEGLTFFQSNGIHLVTTTLYGDVPFEFEKSAFSPHAFTVLLKTLPLFNQGIFLISDDTFGIKETESKTLLIKRARKSFPTFSVPSVKEEASFHLNPIEKKPFEKVLMDVLRKYRDDHFIEYNDIALQLQVEPSEEGFDVVALVQYGQKPLTEILRTTSPFFHGRIPSVYLPAYDFIKALGSLHEVSSMKITDRGVLLEFIQMNEGVQQTQLFLHGILPSVRAN